MEYETLYETYKPLLISVAYRMVGTLADAEDLVHDVFVNIQRNDVGLIRHPQAYLIKLITNRCLNFLTSARQKRETYVGPWLPEPLQSPGDHADPATEVIQQETMAYGLLVMMERLSPVERAVFVLREALGYTHAEIARVLGKSETNCRKIYSRAKTKLQTSSGLPSCKSAQAEALAQAFQQAVHTGKFDRFIDLLTEHAVLLSDGGGKVRAAIQPIIGRERIRAFLEGITRKGAFNGVLYQVTLNGQPGLLLIKNGQQAVSMAISFAPHENRTQATHLFLVNNPDKLQHLSHPAKPPRE
jgi:RNA polymerase sigma-70 factor, ECF subfamily